MAYLINIWISFLQPPYVCVDYIILTLYVFIFYIPNFRKKTGLYFSSTCRSAFFSFVYTLSIKSWRHTRMELWRTKIFMNVISCIFSPFLWAIYELYRIQESILQDDGGASGKYKLIECAHFLYDKMNKRRELRYFSRLKIVEKKIEIVNGINLFFLRSYKIMFCRSFSEQWMENKQTWF